MTALLDIPTVRFLTKVRRLGAALLVVSSIAVPSAASASAVHDPSFEPSSCTQASIGAASIPLAGAVFTARALEDGLGWDARFILDVDAAFDFRGGVLPFAVPLPSGEELVPAPGLAAVTDGDRIVGLCVGRDALRDRTVSASFVQRPAAAASVGVELGAPVAAGSAVQIIETSIGERRIEPAATPLLEKHVGYVAPRAISHGAREEARRLTDVRAKVSTSPIYVRGDDVHAIGGLTGRIVDPQTRARRSAAGVGIVFAGIVGALVLAARKLRDTAGVERADALLASEIDATTRLAPPARPEEQR